MGKQKNLLVLCGLILLGCLVMSYVDGVLQPGYGIKSVIKLVTFILLPSVYFILNHQSPLRVLFPVKREGIKTALLLGLGVYGFILGAYFLLRPYFDLSGITPTLEQTIGVTGKNFIWISLYIAFINSLLEEVFFRGFAFLQLKKIAGEGFAYSFSALCFSLYHVAMMSNWVSPILFLLLILSLFVAGLLFNWLNERHDNIYPSWLVHMFANFAINTVGFILFDLL